MGRRPVVSLFGLSDAPVDHPDYHSAARTGRALARAGAVVCTGGYGGIMEAASEGAARAGGLAVGVTVRDGFGGRKPNPWLACELVAPDLWWRTRFLVEIADAFVVYPGKSGTLAEAALVWALVRAGTAPAGRPVLLVGDSWRRLLASLRREGVVDGGVLGKTRVVRSPERMIPSLVRGLAHTRGANA